MIEAFERGERPAQYNPEAAEQSEAQKAQRFGPWEQIKPETQRAIIDSWRLAYRAQREVNWCPALGTVLANEEVIEGKSERGGYPVERREMSQWTLRITAYAKRLQDGLTALAWPKSTLKKQRHWIEGLQDWLFARQRYWGEPIPIVYDEAGVAYPVDEAALPVRLPELEDWAPRQRDEPVAMLDRAQGFVWTTALAAGVGGLPPQARVRRETSTMPSWAGSSWYFLRFAGPMGSAAQRYWMKGGVDLYVGGAEQAVLHLLYARFWHHVLHDLGIVEAREPFARLFHQGLIQRQVFVREDGSFAPEAEVEAREEGFFERGAKVQRVLRKMGKSLGNAISPEEVIEAYGVDTLRLYLMSMGPLSAAQPWDEEGIKGVHRFLQRAWRLCCDVNPACEGVEQRLQKTIAKVTQDIERLSMNTAIASLMELSRFASQQGGFDEEQAARFCQLLAPFAPHIAEELWSRLAKARPGKEGPIIDAPWPKGEEAAQAVLRVVVQVQGKRRAEIEVFAGADPEEVKALALAHPRAKKHVGARKIARVVYVPGRLVNVVLE